MSRDWEVAISTRQDISKKEKLVMVSGPEQNRKNLDQQPAPEKNVSEATTPVTLTPVRMADLDFSKAPVVQGVGHRFLIPVPDLGQENQEHVLPNWKGEAETIVGFKFFNGTDTAAQAVKGDGTGVIIVALNPEKADLHQVSAAIYEKIGQLGGLSGLQTAQLTELLKYINSELGIVDNYCSTDKIGSTMKAVSSSAPAGARPFGLYEKDDKAGPLAVFVASPAEVLDGPHAGSANYKYGFMAVKIPAKEEGAEPSYRSIAPEAIGYCYRLANGDKIIDPATQLPTVVL